MCCLYEKKKSSLSFLYIISLYLFLLQVVSNLPFNISTDVVKLLLPMGDIFSEVVLLLQVGNIFIYFYFFGRNYLIFNSLNVWVIILIIE